MKLKFFIMSFILLILQSTSINAQTMKKVLVVYYSYSGNTEVIAKQIQNAMGADIFRIVPQNEYPKEYKDVIDQAKKEINSSYKPKLKTNLENIDKYDIIFVGSPNWWSTIAPPVSTFLSSYNFQGKTIVPFITHEGSRLGIAVDDIKKLCPKSTVTKGLAIRGSNVNNSNSEVIGWLKEYDLIK